MYTHKKAHKWVWWDWWDFKKLLEGISLELFPTAPQCQSQGKKREMEVVRRGEKNKPNTASHFNLNPFNYSPKNEAWGAKKEKALIYWSPAERTPLQVLKHSETLIAWGYMDEQVQICITLNKTNVSIIDHEVYKVLPVSCGSMDSVISVPSMLSSSSTTALPLVRPLEWGRDTNRGSEKRSDRNFLDWTDFWRGELWCSHKLVKYNYSCQWLLLEALKPWALLVWGDATQSGIVEIYVYVFICIFVCVCVWMREGINLV